MDFGDLSELGKNISAIIPLILLVLFQIFMRRRRTEKTTPEVVNSLLKEINQNQQLMEAFLVTWQTNKFKTDSWQRNKNRLDFLDQHVHTALTGAYDLAEDFNRDITSAKKFKSSSYLANVNVEKLREPLAHSRKGLEEWLNLGAEQQGSQR
ncbi:hypothetical protein ACFLVF_00180 [Chloroflexota bacterium]